MGASCPSNLGGQDAHPTIYQRFQEKSCTPRKFLALKFLALKFLALKFLALKFLALKFLALTADTLPCTHKSDSTLKSCIRPQSPPILGDFEAESD